MFLYSCEFWMGLPFLSACALVLKTCILIDDVFVLFIYYFPPLFLYIGDPVSYLSFCSFFVGVNSSIFWIFLHAYHFVGSNMRCDGIEIMCNVEN